MNKAAYTAIVAALCLVCLMALAVWTRQPGPGPKETAAAAATAATAAGALAAEANTEPTYPPPWAEFRGKPFALSGPLRLGGLKKGGENDGIDPDPVDAEGNYLPMEGDYKALPRLEGRWLFSPLLERLGAKTALEVGVRWGDFSVEMQRKWPSFEKYYMIDSWTHSPDTKGEMHNGDNENQERMYNSAREKMSKHSNKVVIIRKDPIEAAKDVPDDSVDFIYLDYNHNYCSVWSYLVAYWPKLRKGGVMAGHNYIDSSSPLLVETKQDWSTCADGTKNPGAVKGAVDDFKRAMGDRMGKVHATNDGWISFYARKVA